MTENPVLIVDYGRRRVRLTHSTPAAQMWAPDRRLWDQSQWCAETFPDENFSYSAGRWYFKRPQDLTMFLMRWA